MKINKYNIFYFTQNKILEKQGAICKHFSSRLTKTNLNLFQEKERSHLWLLFSSKNLALIFKSCLILVCSLLFWNSGNGWFYSIFKLNICNLVLVCKTGEYYHTNKVSIIIVKKKRKGKSALFLLWKIICCLIGRAKFPQYERIIFP